jgi:hypothetical protein
MPEGTADERPKTSSFEPPPKYLASLIGSINDGAKAAQTSALFLAFVGLYLSATAISISDEDLLKGAAIQLSQLGGVSVPVIVSFLLGPILFFVLHASLLMRYSMLVSGLRRFCEDLKKTVPDDADRIRCRNLLASVDFVRMIAGQGRPGFAWEDAALSVERVRFPRGTPCRRLAGGADQFSALPERGDHLGTARGPDGGPSHVGRLLLLALAREATGSHGPMARPHPARRIVRRSPAGDPDHQPLVPRCARRQRQDRPIL